MIVIGDIVDDEYDLKNAIDMIVCKLLKQITSHFGIWIRCRLIELSKIAFSIETKFIDTGAQ